MAITDPRPLFDRIDRDRFLRLLGRGSDAKAPSIRREEPVVDVVASAGTAAKQAGSAAASAGVRGRVQRFGDNVDTDAIIPGEFCHLQSEAELGGHAFHHVRPEFREKVALGATIVVAGDGWGSGSSREQAVLALKGAGVRAVIARSYAFIHKRNLVNEAVPYLVVRDTQFDALAAEDAELAVDLATGVVTHVASGRTFQALSPSPIVVALQREGGIVPAIQHHGAGVFGALTS